jgi:hypothetical protein
MPKTPFKSQTTHASLQLFSRLTALPQIGTCALIEKQNKDIIIYFEALIIYRITAQIKAKIWK